jgi:hypothetical protein
MANKNMTDLAAGIAVAAGDFFLTRQGADTEDRRATAAQIATYMGSASLAFTNKTFTATVTPTSNDGAALGTTALAWSDLFLAAGAVINFANGDVLITQGTNTLAFSGASLGYTFDARNVVTAARTDVTAATILDVAGAGYSGFDWQNASAEATAVRFADVSYIQHSTNNNITSHYGGVLGYAQKTGTGTDAYVIGVEGRVGAVAGVITLGAAVVGTCDNDSENAGTFTSFAMFSMPAKTGAETAHITTNKWFTYNPNADWPSYSASKETYDSTITAPGTTGARTINKPTGKVNFAAGATSLVVTNSLCTANSIVLVNQQSLDASMVACNAIPDAGFFTLIAVGTPAAEVKVGFMVIN